jgi:outer membrane receptor protein involved in Fe transport
MNLWVLPTSSINQRENQSMKLKQFNPEIKVTSTLLTVVAGIGIFCAGLLPLNAQAQEETAGVLEQITVTAQRRETDLQSTPVSITAVTGARHWTWR